MRAALRFTLHPASLAVALAELRPQTDKEDLGLDHIEGRSWAGLHRQALMTTMALAFLQARRLAGTDRKKGAAAVSSRRSPAYPRSAKRSSTISVTHSQLAARIAMQRSPAHLDVNLPN